MRRHVPMLVIAVLAAGCEGVDPQVPVAYPVPYATRVEVRPEVRVVVAPSAPPEANRELAPGEWPSNTGAVSSDILVTTARKLERATEVVGVIDAHEPSGRQDAAFALIRERAAAMGADAVVGVEFHHGEEKDEPTHLSGLAVRYVDRSR